MDSLPTGPHNVFAWFLLATALLSAILVWRKALGPWFRGLRRDFVAGRDALVGREAITDSITGKEIAPALPGIGQRMAVMESAVARLAEQHDAITNLDQRVKKLEAAEAAKVMNSVEHALLYKAMDSAIKATPDTEAEATED